MTPRGTDWSLALLVALGVGTGLGTWFAGAPPTAWVVAAHAAGGIALGLVLVWKLRRVLPRLGARLRRDPDSGRGALAVALVGAVLVSGVLWSTAGRIAFGGATLL